MEKCMKSGAPSYERTRTGPINSRLRACLDLISRRWTIVLWVLVTIAAAGSQAAAQQGIRMSPGMPFIVQNAIRAPMLPEYLTGQIPATIPQTLTLPDPTGQITTYQIANGGVGPSTGTTVTATNGFFSSTITTNGRTCFTCHQPQNDWEISPPQILAELITTEGRSVLFHPIDAADCPKALGATASFPDPLFLLARSQLFTRGNFRISLNAPNPLGLGKLGYTTFDGNTTPQWVLTVVYDPYGCEKDTTYGLPANLVSVYRRPLNAANLVFLDQNPGFYQNTNIGSPPPPNNIPPEERQDIMWDAREVDLAHQFVDATEFHGQTNNAPGNDAISQGILFQSGLFVAQTYDNVAKDLTGSDGSGALGGPVNLYNAARAATGTFSLGPSESLACVEYEPTLTSSGGFTLPYISGVLPLGAFDQLVCPGVPAIGVPPTTPFVTQIYLAFATPTTGSAAQKAQRESIARGEALFNGKTLSFNISNVAGLNDVVGANPLPGSCSACHNNTNAVNDAFGDPKRLGIMDNSNKVPPGLPLPAVTVMPITPDFPQFAFYCPSATIPYFSNPVTSMNCPGSTSGHPATCDEFITTDPGKGLITGKCTDLGRMKVPILRGVAARAPYFHGGNAATLTNVVNFYNNRFNIGLSAQQKSDLINYLNSL